MKFVDYLSIDVVHFISLIYYMSQLPNNRYVHISGNVTCICQVAGIFGWMSICGCCKKKMIHELLMSCDNFIGLFNNYKIQFLFF